MGIRSRITIFPKHNLLLSVFLSSAWILAGPAAASSALLPDPPDKTVRVFYIRPTDVAENPKYATGIASVMRVAQQYYLDQCKFTFKLNEPIVEVVNGSHPRSWYETDPGGGSDDVRSHVQLAELHHYPGHGQHLQDPGRQCRLLDYLNPDRYRRPVPSGGPGGIPGSARGGFPL